MKAVIVAAKRTAIGKFMGQFSSLSAVDLATQLLSQMLEQTPSVKNAEPELFMGQVLTAACGQNPARQVALNAGLPVTSPAITLNAVCGSGLKAVQLAVQAIQSGAAEVAIAGGVESMSQAPRAMKDSRGGVAMGSMEMVDTMIVDGLWDAFNDYHMGITAENLADRWQITREEQDAFAAQSQQRAKVAIESGKFDKEILPVSVPQRRKDPIIVDKDEQPKFDTTAEGIAKLRPAFKKDGSVTAANASSLNDGAAFVFVCSEAFAQKHGLDVLVTVEGAAMAGVDPAIMGYGPAESTRKLLGQLSWSVDSLDVVEANEAFAVQALTVAKEMGWSDSKVNVNGGAIALGHPIGGSGCRVLVTLIHEMEKQSAKRGLATLCIGGGMGISLAVSR